MMKKKIEKANIPSLSELQEIAQLEGVELVACEMTIDMMEIDESELVEGVVDYIELGVHFVLAQRSTLPAIV